MITLTFGPHSQFDLAENIQEKVTEIKTRHFTSWIDLPYTTEKEIRNIQEFVELRKGSWDQLIVLGMGGSALGISTIKQALFPFDNRLQLVDNLDSNRVHHLLESLNPERTLVLVISKSGGTLETMTNYYIFKNHFSPEQYKKNFIALTDPDTGFLREIVDRDGLTSFPIPPAVGGRFSVLTPVGLLPLALMGGDTRKLLSGAQSMHKRTTISSIENPALHLAYSVYTLYKKGIHINSIISYSDQLYTFGLWYQQLLAESIGKNRDIGITPLALRGASDQHSVLQLLQEGPNDKLNIFLYLENSQEEINIPYIKDEKFSDLNIDPNRNLHDVLKLAAKGTQQALDNDGIPTLTVHVTKVNEESLGELFFLFEMQVAILGELFEIDAFNQPGVEKSKILVKKSLQTDSNKK